MENLDGNFITTDQPVINIHAGCENKIPEDFELYYPISPSLALIISKQAKYPDRTILTVDNAEVMLWNKRMVELSYNQLFSDKNSILESYRVGD